MFRRLPKVLLLPIVIALLTSLSAQAQDLSVQQDWSMSSPDPTVKSQGIVFMEPTIYPGSTSYLREQVVPDIEKSIYCSSLKDAKCAKSKMMDFRAYLAKCSTGEDVNCVEEVWLSSGEQKYQADFKNYMPESFETSFDGDPSIHLPKGSSPSIWKVSGVDGVKDVFLAVNPVIRGAIDRGVDGTLQVVNQDIEVTIDEIEIIGGNYRPPALRNNVPSLDGCLGLGCVGVQVGPCAALSVGSCAKRIASPREFKFGITLRLSKPPINWIHGRMNQQVFEVEKFPNFMKWKVSGTPIILPVTSGWISYETYREKINSNGTASSSMASWTGPLNAGSHAMNQFASWEPFLEKKASALQSRWSFRTLGPGSGYNGKSITSCLKNEDVIGVVTTNAMVYQGEPPTWNSKTDSLDYQVAAPHLQPNGEPFLGSYNLKIDEEIARCIYGFGSAPLRATISIVAPDGQARVATSIFSKQDKWLVFSVNGFTYSTPQIKVKLTEEKLPEVTAPTSTPSAPSSSVSGQVAAKKVKTIVCRKSKLVKKVTATAPVCPKGYKKS